jgi:hypothetical protein
MPLQRVLPLLDASRPCLVFLDQDDIFMAPALAVRV